MAQLTLYVDKDEMNLTHEQMHRQMKFAIPIWLWHPVRMMSVGVGVGLCIILFIFPDIGLKITWGVAVPILPLVFFVIPGLWRNICPLSASNQAPRWLDLTHDQLDKSWMVPSWIKNYGYLISIGLFLIIVPLRKIIFNFNGPALALLILAIVSVPFIMGMRYKGKSGWCSSICPILPVERIYGQTPFITLPNSHCQPCVDCTAKCYDKQPHTAYLKDLYADDNRHTAYRKFFVGLFPGFMVAFYTLPSFPNIGVFELYGQIALYCAISLASFYVIDNLFADTSLNIGNTKITLTPNLLTAIYGAAAFNLYYWFTPYAAASTLEINAPLLFTIPIHVLVLSLSLFWLYRTAHKEQIYTAAYLQPKESINVTFDDTATTAVPGTSLLNIVKKNNLPLKYSCESGTCEADPVCILEGMENLSPIGPTELATLEKLDRIGTAKLSNTRMACMAYVLRGNIKVSLIPQSSKSSIIDFSYNPDVESVVIIGNGIAGYQAAYQVYRRHRRCDIYLIGDENHLTYQRIGIAKLISKPKLVQELYLKPEEWYTARRITLRTKERVEAVDTHNNFVILNSGETIAYDRLVFATGSESRILTNRKTGQALPGLDLDGTFNLYKVADSIDIQSYVQSNNPKTAIVYGGGVTAIEVAYEISKLGEKTNLQVLLLCRSGLLKLEDVGQKFVLHHLSKLDFDIRLKSEVVALNGEGQVESVTLANGETLACDMFVACIGVQPNTELAQKTGITVNRGIVVDDEMQTNLPHIYAVGDVAEHEGLIPQLVVIAQAQAEVAAINSIRSNISLRNVYQKPVPNVKLKIDEFTLTMINSVHKKGTAEITCILTDEENKRYCKLIVSDNIIVEGVLLECTAQQTNIIQKAIEQKLNIKPYVPALKRGIWAILNELEEEATV